MNSTNPSSPVCLVTGGTSGIGRQTIQLFAHHGYRIATCGRDSARLDSVRQELGGGHLVEQVDLADVGQTRTFADRVGNELGRIDVFVNNAAVAPLSPFDQIDEETFENALNINIRSPFYLTQIVWRKMMQQGRGVIVNISSLAAVDPFPNFSIYGASKAWLDLLTKALKSEGEEHRIRIYSIRAGAVETPLLRRTFPDFPAEQCVSPDAIAAEVFACVENKYDNGSLLVVANQS